MGIGQKQLTGMLAEALKAAAVKPSLPILAGMVLEVKDSTMFLTCTDLDQYLTVKRLAFGLPEGKIIIKGKETLSILKTFPAGDIDLEFEPETESEPGAVIFRQGRIESRVKGLAINEDWPVMPEPSEPVRFTITPEKLTECIKHVQDVVIVDENKPNLSGIFFIAEEGKLAAVTTDTRRLARYAVDIPGGLPDSTKFILPLSAAKLIPGLFKTDDNRPEGLTVSIYPSKPDEDNKEVPRPECISFDSGDKNLLVRLIEGEFPDYKSVVQDVTEFPRVNLSSKETISALKRIGTLVSKGKNIVILEIAGNVLKLSGEFDGTTISETFDVAFSFPEVKADFNPRYLIDGIKAVDGDRFVLYLNPDSSGEKPSVIKGVDDQDKYLYLIMSIRDCRPVVLTEEEKEALRLEEVEQDRVDIELEAEIDIPVPTGPSVEIDKVCL